MGGEGIGEIRNTRVVTRVIADVPSTDSLGNCIERLVNGEWQLEKWMYSW